jgi:hypothetical protein
MAMRFGSAAVDKGFITRMQCTKALEVQAREDKEKRKHRLLGQILIDMKLLTQKQVNEVLDTMTHAMSYMILSGR